MSIESLVHNMVRERYLGLLFLSLLRSLGWLLMRISRKIFRFTLGRCSYCGATCGFNSAISSKGLRCALYYRDCTKRP